MLHVSFCVYVCTWTCLNAHAHTHTHRVQQCYAFNALTHIYICNCSYNNSNRETAMEKKTHLTMHSISVERERRGLRKSHLCRGAILSFHIIFCSHRACIQQRSICSDSDVCIVTSKWNAQQCDAIQSWSIPNPLTLSNFVSVCVRWYLALAIAMAASEAVVIVWDYLL